MDTREALQVVVIEDDENLLRLYELRFKAATFAVDFIGFKRASDAMDHMMKSSADLVIVDMHLPDTNGYDLIGKLYSLFAMYGTKVIVVSGRDEVDIRANGVLPDEVSVFSKPVPFEYLLEKMQLMHTFKMGLSSKFLGLND
jgi:DNA-binding response OmpR family regulator